MKTKAKRPAFDLFSEALELEEGGEREQFLRQKCGEDSGLRKKVEQLLRAHSRAGGFFSKPSARADGAAVVDEPSASERAGDRIGRYKLLQEIGQGGCGEVYMAEQEEPVRRRVALKIVKLGMDTKQVVARFEAERQALALMDHPNIAQVLDGGATGSGRPFFVMELVRGVRITEFCNQRRLSTKARLELFVQVCGAVQHAHQKGIIHRDLKPSNILVTTLDGTHLPKVIDFGIAKATNNQRLTDKTVFTAFEQFIGTPAYMSPEQAEMSGVDIDTRTDIYSLGVVLYELLTGRPPFGPEELLGSGLDELRQTIREREPAKPSTRLSTLDVEEATTVATEREMEIPALLKAVRGDLDWIVMKCLEKDRNRRYETASALAEDVQRHLSGEPIRARPASNFYRFRKLVMRHQAVSALSAVLVMSLGVSSVVLWCSQRQLQRSLSAEQTSRAAEVEAHYSSLVGQARAQRQSGRMGQRYETLETIRKAARIRPAAELRSELAAALATPDLRLARKWPVWFRSSLTVIGFSPDLGSYLEGTTNAVFLLRSSQDQSVLQRFPSTNSGSIKRGRFSADGQSIIAEFQYGALEVWSRSNAQMLLQFPGSAADAAVADFHPDGATLAAHIPGEGVFLVSLTNGSRREMGSSKEPVLNLRFDAKGQRLGVARKSGVEMWSCPSNAPLWKLPLQDTVGWLSWSPNGRWLLAASGIEHEILMLEAANGKVFSRFPLQGYHPGLFEFHPSGLSIAAESWDRMLRIWDLMTSEELVRAPGSVRALRFSADGLNMAGAPANFEVGHYELAPMNVFRELRPKSVTKMSPSGFSRSSRGRFLLSTVGNQLTVWDTVIGEEVHSVNAAGEERSTTFFGPGDGEIYYSRWNAGIQRRTFAAQEGSGTGDMRITLGSERSVTTHSNVFLWDVAAANGSWLTESRFGKPFLWEKGNHMRAKGPITPTRGWLIMRISPDARCVLTTVYPGADLYVWDVAGRTNIHTFHGHSVGDAWFSPDGKWIVAATPKEYCLWKVGTWEPGPVWPADLGGLVGGHVAFAQGGSMIALQDSQDTFRVLTFPEGRELVRLEPPKLLGVFGSLMNEEGTRLWLLGFGNRVYEWRLDELRKELASLSLDWESQRPP